MKTIECPPGQWTIVMNCIASGMPWTWKISTHRADGGPLQGKYRESRSYIPLGIGLRQVAQAELKPVQDFTRNWTDASYRLEFWSDQGTLKVTVE